MTERKPARVSFGDWVERQIRQAQQRGGFDNLPGQGKPIPGINEPQHELAWVAGLVRRENLPVSALLPPSLALAKEVEDLPETLRRLTSESAVRKVVEDLNHRIMQAHRLPQAGPPMRVMARDVDQVVAAWRKDRDAR
ncbi:MAG: molecular chaperone DnaJ [Frankiales bacterium]|nr:molecular chaperone DnaJ [Frankiales bacterium]